MNKTITHGHYQNGYRSLTYNSWRSMKERCFNSHHKKYYLWGGRGITVCAKWMSFIGFLEDMGERPEGKYLDRYPNNLGNYEPGNVRWATPKEQAQNFVKDTRFKKRLAA